MRGAFDEAKSANIHLLSAGSLCRKGEFILRWMCVLAIFCFLLSACSIPEEESFPISEDSIELSDDPSSDMLEELSEIEDSLALNSNLSNYRSDEYAVWTEVEGFETYKEILDGMLSQSSLEYGDEDTNLFVYQVEDFNQNGIEGKCILMIQQFRNAFMPMGSPMYLLTDVAGTVQYYEIGYGVVMPGIDWLWLHTADIDGDRCDEIILALNQTSTGMDVSYRNLILRYNQGIEIIFDNISRKESHFDTGFVTSYSDGYIYHIQNTMTGYSLTFVDCEDPWGFDHFTDEGTVRPQTYSYTGEIPIHRNFYSLCPVDIDGDGIYEVVGIEGNRGFPATEYVLLRYDPIGNTFIVLRAAAFPHLSYRHLETSEERLQAIQEFEQEFLFGS